MSHQVKSPEPIFDKIFLGFMGMLGKLVVLLKKTAMLAIILGVIGYIIAVSREEFGVDYFFKPIDGTQIQKGR